MPGLMARSVVEIESALFDGDSATLKSWASETQGMRRSFLTHRHGRRMSSFLQLARMLLSLLCR